MWFVDCSCSSIELHIISNPAAATYTFLIVYTVNTANFFGFGVDAGDTEIERVDNGTSPPINLSTPIRFFGTMQSTLYVCIGQLP